MQIAKKVIRIGNGAAVYVPKEYINAEVLIVLPENEKEIKRKIVEKLMPYFSEIIGIYLSGSYARGEEQIDSDVDVLAITQNTNKKIKEENFDILLISKDVLEKTLEKNILPLLPMLNEAKTIINPIFLDKIKNIELTNENLKFHFETTKSALKLNKSSMELAKESKENCSDSAAYSLVLRLREAYIVDCLIKKRQWSNKELIDMIVKLTGSDEIYFGYKRVKNDEKEREIVRLEDAEKIYNYLKNKILEQEKWVKRRKY
ncbi:nucleotidyltransferase domain-containing protein [Candidatus Pacearchaeota archaeon]|nr:nucleotidyltransferase domain-containing protein [Candidatus Pacearchaeota archaeon]